MFSRFSIRLSKIVFPGKPDSGQAGPGLDRLLLRGLRIRVFAFRPVRTAAVVQGLTVDPLFRPAGGVDPVDPFPGALARQRRVLRHDGKRVQRVGNPGVRLFHALLPFLHVCETVRGSFIIRAPPLSAEKPPDQGNLY